MKAEKCENPSIFLATYWNLIANSLVIWIFSLSKSGGSWGIFFMIVKS
jgi:hypothetical protein